MVNAISLKPIAFFRSVTHSNGNEARRLTLPAQWVKRYSYPAKVFVVTGNIIIVADKENQDLALKAAQCLYENELMRPIEEPEENS